MNLSTQMATIALVTLAVGGLSPTTVSAQEGGESTPESSCLDFVTQQEAQAFFEAEGGPESDPHGMDSDRNGIACDGVAVAVLSEGGTVLAQAPTPDPNAPGPLGSGGTTTQGSPTPTSPPLAAPTNTPSSATPAPTASSLPKSGSRAQTFGLSGIALLLVGLVLMAIGRQGEDVDDEYALIGW